MISGDGHIGLMFFLNVSKMNIDEYRIQISTGEPPISYIYSCNIVVLNINPIFNVSKSTIV